MSRNLVPQIVDEKAFEKLPEKKKVPEKAPKKNPFGSFVYY